MSDVTLKPLKLTLPKVEIPKVQIPKVATPKVGEGRKRQASFSEKRGDNARRPWSA